VIDRFLFGIFPYLAFVLAVAGVAYRLRVLPGTVSARSSQLLEGRLLYWGSVPWHLGVLVVLGAHLLAAVAPGAWGRLLGSPSRLLALEVTGLALGALCVLGVVLLAARRLGRARAMNTTPMDGVVLLLLGVQAVTGVWIAYGLRWGSVWYLHAAAPWLGSLVKLAPEVERMAVLPLVVKVHAVNAFVLLALVPISRLVHVTSFPLHYLWRPPQVVVWRRAKASLNGGSR
jgi:nitrate reductase gamma subunit